MMKRADEDFCKVEFDAFLRRDFSPSEITWLEVAQQDEPPDYYLDLRGKRFAVEVTTLLEKVSVGTASPLPLHVIINILQCFVKDMEAIAKAKGFLRGNYLIIFSTTIDDFSSVRDKIRKKSLDYIRTTKEVEMCSAEIVFERFVPEQRPQRCGIQKVGNKQDKICCLGPPVVLKWEGEATADLCSLINDSLTTKRVKLGDIVSPKILLLLDEYVFADIEMYENCVSQISSLDFFHTVFVAQYSRGGFIFYSRRSDWSQYCPF